MEHKSSRYSVMIASLVLTPYDTKSRRCSTVMCKACLREFCRMESVGDRSHIALILHLGAVMRIMSEKNFVGAG